MDDDQEQDRKEGKLVLGMDSSRVSASCRERKSPFGTFSKRGNEMSFPSR